ncbi:MAG: DUF11 domain-containing protein [Chloroflexi bacterium]|nr:DUF11 domain-containing protein [Chloroflexota bacterium]
MYRKLIIITVAGVLLITLLLAGSTAAQGSVPLRPRDYPQTGTAREVWLTTRADRPEDLWAPQPGFQRWPFGPVGGRPGAVAARPGSPLPLSGGQAEAASPVHLSVTPAITLSLTFDSFFGYTAANATVTATLKTGETFKGLAVALVDGLGWLGNTSFFDQGRAVDVAPGDTADFFVNGAQTTVTLPTITGRVDPATDVVSGTIAVVPLPANLTITVHGRSRVVASDAAGNFTTDWTGTADIGQDDQADVSYEMTGGFWAMANLFPQNGVTVYGDWNGVWGYTAPGETVTVTLRAGDGTLKESGTAMADATTGGWWYVTSADIVPGDQVEVQVGGETLTSTVSEITAAVDVAADTVSGTGPASSNLMVSFQTWEGTWSHSLERTVPTAPDGSFNADFSADGLGRYRGWGYAIHADTPRADTSVFLAAPIAQVNQTLDDIWGLAAPGAEVTITLTDSTGAVKDVQTATADPGSGYFEADFAADVVPGDTVQAAGTGIAATVPITTLTAAADRTADTVSGSAAPNASHLRVRRWDSPQNVNGPYYERGGFASDASGAYTTDLSAEVDLHSNHGGEVQYHTDDDPDEHTQAVHYWTPYLLVAATYDWTWGQTTLPGVPVTLSLLDSTGATKATTTVTGDPPDGSFWVDWPKFGATVEPGDRVVMDAGTFTDTVTVVGVDATVDADADLVTGTGPAWSLLWVQVWWSWPPLYVPTDGQGNFVADFSGIQDIEPGELVQVGYTDENFHDVVHEFMEPHLLVRANRTHDWVQGEAPQDTNVVVRLLRGGQEIGRGESHTGGGTGFNTSIWDEHGKERVDIQTGDVVEVTAGTLSATVVMVDMSGSVDAAANTVSGQVFGVPYPANVRVEVWVQDGQSRDVQTDGAGNFLVDFGTFDMEQGNDIGIWYVQPDGHMAGIVRSDFALGTELTSDGFHGQTAPNARVDLILSTPGQLMGGVKGTTTVWANDEGQFGGGFTGEDGKKWVDIAPGDIIEGQTAGKTATLNIPSPLTAIYDHVANTVCGQAPPGTQLTVDLWKVGMESITVGASGDYCVDFSTYGDPQIWNEGTISLSVAGGFRVSLNFGSLTPDLWVQKWGDDQPAVGREFHWFLRVGNSEQASAAASNVTVTDTLPPGTTFVAESTGTATVVGNQVIMNLGTLEIGQERTITLTVRVDASVPPGTDLENCVQVGSGNWERDAGNNGACDRRQVVPDEVDVWVGKWAGPKQELCSNIELYQSRILAATSMRSRCPLISLI